MNDVEDLREAIIQADWVALAKSFDKERRPAPYLEWDPSDADLAHDSLRMAFASWADGRRGEELPHYRTINPSSLRPHLGLVTLLEPVKGGTDFRYRLYGTRVADLAGFEMNGKLVSEMNSAPVMVAFLIAGHMAVSRRRQPLLSIHEPPPTSNVNLWTRVILPFADDRGEVARLLVMNQPGELRKSGAHRLPRYYKPLLG